MFADERNNSEAFRQSQCLEERQKKADGLFADHPQQPANVIARGTQHGMHRIARLPLERTAIHAVIGFQMTDDRFALISCSNLFEVSQLLWANMITVESRVRPIGPNRRGV